MSDLTLHHNREITKLCLTCLEKNEIFVNLSTCKHSGILEKLCSVKIPKLELGCLVCYSCHTKLKTIHDFKLQAEESFTKLWSRQYAATKSAPKFEKSPIVINEIYLECQPEGLTNSAIKHEPHYVTEYQELATSSLLSDAPPPGIAPRNLQNEPKIKEERVPDLQDIVEEAPHHSPEDNVCMLDLDVDIADDAPLERIKREVEGAGDSEDRGPGSRKLDLNDVKKAARHTKKRQFHCAECNKYYSNQRSFRFHNVTIHHHPKKVAPQRYSFEDFAGAIKLIILSHEELMLERETERNSEAFFRNDHRCDTCIVSFRHKETLRDHNARKHRVVENSFQCGICKSVFDNKHNMRKHEKLHYTRYECVACHKRQACRSSIVDHYTNVHETDDSKKLTFSCNLCEFTTTVRKVFFRHKATHVHKHCCFPCGTRFTSKQSLSRHNIVVHAKSKESHPCDQCDQSFSQKLYLKRHIETKHRPPPLPNADTDEITSFYCDACNKYFKNDASLKTHLTRSLKHAGDKFKRYICDMCSKRFINKSFIRDHIAWAHLNIKLYTCPHCPKSYETAYALRKHIKTAHTDKMERPKNYICDYCGIGFWTPVQLSQHVNRHTGARPFKCAHCPATFAQSAARYTHGKLKHKIPTKRKRN